jgi:cytochrome c biogenesis protein CcdA
MGPVLLAIGLGLLVNRMTYRAAAKQFLDSPALTYVAGLLAMPVGLAVVLVHNIWAADWRLIITVLGWLSLLGGLIRIVVPQLATAMGTGFWHREWLRIAAALAYILLGAALMMFGFRLPLGLGVSA